MRTTENTFQNINGHELEVQFVENNKSIGVLIKRLNYDEEEKSKIKRILIELICCMLLYGICGVHKAIVIACLILLISASFEIYLVVTSLEFEKLDYIEDFCLQYIAKHRLGETRTFIPIENIEHIVINEVIYGFRVIHVLNVLIKGPQSKTKLAVVSLSNLKPNLQCLKVIYTLLQLNKWDHLSNAQK